jgi:MFS transporter, FHS family, glucose/mannose:H+ symporter
MVHHDDGEARTAIYVAAFILTGMVTTVLGPILPELLETWQLSDAAAGAQFSGSLSAGLTSGLIVSRIGHARTLATGYGTMSAGLLAITAGGYAAGVFGAFAAGIGMGLVISPTNLLVARGRPDRAAAALGGLNFAWGIGATLWPIVIAVAVPHAGIRQPLFALALLCAVASIRILTSSGNRDRPAAGNAVQLSAATGRVALFAVLVVLYSGTEMAIGGWLPELARRLPSGVSDARSAAVGAAFWVGLSAGRGLIALGLNRRHEDPAVFAGLAVTSCSVLMLVTAHGSTIVIAAAVLAGIGLGPVFPVTAAALSREMPIRMAGPLLSLGALGSATIPWLVGMISDTSQSLAAGIASLLGSLAILGALHMARRAGAVAPRPTGS